MQDKDGHTPIFYAIGKKNVDIFMYLAENGADIDHKEILNRTPLYWAASTGFI
jgi:ankyrin repeat protein